MHFCGKAGCFAPGESPGFDEVKNKAGCQKEFGNKFTAFKSKSSQKQKLKLFFVDLILLKSEDYDGKSEDYGENRKIIERLPENFYRMILAGNRMIAG